MQGDDVREESDSAGGLAGLALTAVLAGAVAGLLAALLRLCLAEGDALRQRLVDWSGAAGSLGWIVVILSAAAATALAAALVRRLAPLAGGSGIPHVEAVIKGEMQPSPPRLIAVKFVGGLLAIGSGLALGREGPSVQMGATAAHRIGRWFRRSERDCVALLAAGAGAGLATAFGAPFAGAIFVLEELVRRFDTRITIATLAASTGAIAVARTLLSDQPIFALAPLPNSELRELPLFVLLGVLAGLLGVAYNRAIVGTLVAAQRLRALPVQLRAAGIGAIVGLLACAAPALVGGGDGLTSAALAGQGTLVSIAALFLLRFALGALSYAALTPGGLFAPLLTLGALTGLGFALLCQLLLPHLALHPAAFAAVGMAAFFTAMVRAPVTGIVLVLEMTALSSQFLPLLAASAAAMLVAELLRAPPIYDQLRELAAKHR